MRILVFGDSITQGFHDVECGGWCSRLVAEVIRRDVESDYTYNRSVVNLGVSGDSTKDVLNRIEAESEARLTKFPTDTHDVLVLAIGVNDSQFEMVSRKNKVECTATIENILEMINVTSHLFKEVVIVGIAPVWDPRIQPMAWKQTHGYSNEVIGVYNTALEKFAVENKYQFIDMSDVYDDNDACLPDGIHPNAEGHRLIYERVKSELEKAGIL